MSNDLSIVRDVLGEELSPESIDAAVRNAAFVIPRLVEAWYPGVDELPARRPGELSYFVPESAMISANRSGQAVSLAYDRGLTALLYVHRIVVNSPLLWLSSAALRGKPLELCRDHLLTSLHLLLSLKELIDAGIVVIIGSIANYDVQYGAVNALIDKIGQSEWDNLDPALRYNILHSLNSGCAIDIFATSSEQYLRLWGILGEDRRCGLASHSDAVHLSAFLEEVVPDASDLDLREVVRIRQDDTFEQWRTDLRAAVRQMITVDSTVGLAGEGPEEMRAMLHEKATNITEAVATSRSMAKLRNRAADFAIAGIGAASMVPIVGQTTAVAEVTMLAGSLGVGALSIGLDAMARSRRNQNADINALAHHYAFVGKCIRR